MQSRNHFHLNIYIFCKDYLIKYGYLKNCTVPTLPTPEKGKTTSNTTGVTNDTTSSKNDTTGAFDLTGVTDDTTRNENDTTGVSNTRRSTSLETNRCTLEQIRQALLELQAWFQVGLSFNYYKS